MDRHAELESALVALFRHAHHTRVSLPGGRSLERSQYALMCRLRDEGRQRTSEVASAMGLDLSTVSRQLASLIAEGWVVRSDDPHDRRAHLLELTRTGRSLVDRGRAARRQMMRELLADWPDADIDELARLLGRLNTDLRTLYETPEKP